MVMGELTQEAGVLVIGSGPGRDMRPHSEQLIWVWM